MHAIDFWAIVERHDGPSQPAIVTVDTGDWARFPEVVNYATAKGISVPEAIVRLVNSGLSHLDYTPVDPYRAQKFLAVTE